MNRTSPPSYDSRFDQERQVVCKDHNVRIRYTLRKLVDVPAVTLGDGTEAEPGRYPVEVFCPGPPGHFILCLVSLDDSELEKDNSAMGNAGVASVRTMLGSAEDIQAPSSSIAKTSPLRNPIDVGSPAPPEWNDLLKLSMEAHREASKQLMAASSFILAVFGFVVANDMLAPSTSSFQFIMLLCGILALAFTMGASLWMLMPLPFTISWSGTSDLTSFYNDWRRPRRWLTWAAFVSLVTAFALLLFAF